MNLAQFYRLSNFLVDAYERGNIESAYRQVIAAIQNQINSPGQPHLQALSEALDALEEAVAEAGFDSMPPTWRPFVEELNIEDCVGDVIFSSVRETLTRSGVILTEALEVLQQEFNEIKETYGQLKAVHNALTYLNYPVERLEPGEAEVLVYLPRPLFNDELGGFSEKLKLLNRILSTISEAATGSAQNVKLKEISTTDPILVAVATPATVLLALKIVNSILDAYRKVLEIRSLQNESKRLGLDEGLISKFSQETERIINDTLERFLEEIKKNNGLSNELSGKLSKMMRQLADLIDHGARVEGWARLKSPESDAEGDGADDVESENELLEEIRKMGVEVQKFSGQGQPILNLPKPNQEENE